MLTPPPTTESTRSTSRQHSRTQLLDRLETTVQNERRGALRALLRNPLLSAAGSHAEEFTLVQRHFDWLKEWLLKNTGWTLSVSNDLARLRKTPGDVRDGTRGIRDRRTTLFTRRRYVLLCLALAALERSDRQTTLGRLASDVGGLLGADRVITDLGITLDLRVYDHRKDLVAIMRVLLDFQVIARVDGDEENFLGERGDVLYSIHRPALSAMLSVRRGPSTIQSEDSLARLDQLTETVFPDTDEARNRRIRWRLTRILLDDPVLYFSELSGEERAYTDAQRPALVRQVALATGLLPEVRREGLAMVDPEATLSDADLAEEGTEAHLTLLLAEHLAAHGRMKPEEPIGIAALRGRVAELIQTHRHHWRRTVNDAGADRALLEQALERLEALRLIRRSEDAVWPLPPVARYAIHAPESLQGAEALWKEGGP